MRTPRTVYFVMSVWLLIAPIYRSTWLLMHGIRLDIVPFLSVTLGVTALVLAFRVPRRPRDDSNTQ
jgi:hypothetical protein